MKYKAFFITFKGLSVARNCFRPESVPLRLQKGNTTLELVDPK